MVFSSLVYKITSLEPQIIAHEFTDCLRLISVQQDWFTNTSLQLFQDVFKVVDANFLTTAAI